MLCLQCAISPKVPFSHNKLASGELSTKSGLFQPFCKLHCHVAHMSKHSCKMGNVQGSHPTVQKSASSVNSRDWPIFGDATPIFWYSPTRFSKKLVLPSSDMCSMKSKGFSTLYSWKGTNPYLWADYLLLEKDMVFPILKDLAQTSKTAMSRSTHLCTTKFLQQPVSNKLDVLPHQVTVHSNQCHRQSIRQELLFYLHSIGDDFRDSLLRGLMNQVTEHQAGKVCVQTLEEEKHKTSLKCFTNLFKKLTSQADTMIYKLVWNFNASSFSSHLPHPCWWVHYWRSVQAWLLFSSARRWRQRTQRRKCLLPQQRPQCAPSKKTLHRQSTARPSQPSSWCMAWSQWHWTRNLWK